MAEHSKLGDYSMIDFINDDWTAAVAAPVSSNPAAAQADDIWTSFGLGSSKDAIFPEYPLLADISSIFPPQSASTVIPDQLSLPTSELLAPLSALPAPIEPSLAAFSSSSGSPADSSTSPQASASAVADDPSFDPISESESEMNDDDEEEFAPVRKLPSGKAKGGARGKRAATKARPYPRVSDVVRDAPHKKAVTFEELSPSDNKRSSASTELKGSIRTADAEDDDWRPTLEEYQMMSSKEKRQLRNKISARNFRVRRKEYIATLEGEVADRDQQLEVFREELTTTKSENEELRREIERLRKAILEGRTTGVTTKPDTSSNTAVLGQVNSNAKTTRATRSAVPKFNKNKDLPSSGSTRGFWGGAAMGGSTAVHTTLIPDFDITKSLAAKPKPQLQENLNPLLNSPTLSQSAASSPSPSTPQLSGFDGFADVNSFTFKTLEAYRMQLWQKMAREAGAQAARTSSSPPAWPNHNALSQANALVPPRYFAAPKSPVLKDPTSPTAAQAAVASTLSNGIVNKLSSAFWDAFSGQKPVSASVSPKAFTASSPQSAPTSSTVVDVEKIRKVLEGKAVLRVVDIEKDVTTLEEGIRNVSLVQNKKVPKEGSPTVASLEESMKAMQLTRRNSNNVHNSSTVGCSSVLGIFSQPLRTGHAPGSVANSSHMSQTIAAQH